MPELLKRDPAFGHDPWIGPGMPPEAVVTSATPGLTIASAVPYSAADTLAGDINLLPAGLDAYMSYVDNYGGWGELVARFGHTGAFLISITIFGNPARCADVEPGAMHISSILPWLENHALQDDLSAPWLYGSASTMSAIIAAAGNWKDKKGRRPVRWSAHFGSGPHLCGPATCGYPQADWTQWDDHGAHGENIDRSIGVVLPGPPAPPADPHHYDRYDRKRRVVYGGSTEIAVVKEYDRLRALQTPTSHPSRERLGYLRLRCRLGASRIWTVAHTPGKGGFAPSWRGWRFAELRKRAKGQNVT